MYIPYVSTHVHTTGIGRGRKTDEVNNGCSTGEHGAGPPMLEGEGVWGLLTLLRIPTTAHIEGITATNKGITCHKMYTHVTMQYAHMSQDAHIMSQYIMHTCHKMHTCHNMHTCHKMHRECTELLKVVKFNNHILGTDLHCTNSRVSDIDTRLSSGLTTTNSRVTDPPCGVLRCTCMSLPDMLHACNRKEWRVR